MRHPCSKRRDLAFKIRLDFSWEREHYPSSPSIVFSSVVGYMKIKWGLLTPPCRSGNTKPWGFRAMANPAFGSMPCQDKIWTALLMVPYCRFAPIKPMAFFFFWVTQLMIEAGRINGNCGNWSSKARFSTIVWPSYLTLYSGPLFWQVILSEPELVLRQ